MKITIELDEGIKATSEIKFTEEAVLLHHNKKPGFGTLENFIVDLAARAASGAAYKTLKFLAEYPLVVQRTNKNGERESLRVTDVDEARAWMAEGMKT